MPLMRDAALVLLVLLAGCGRGASVDAGVPCGELLVNDRAVERGALAYADVSEIPRYEWLRYPFVTASRDRVLRLAMPGEFARLTFQNAVAIDRDGSLAGRFWGAGRGPTTWGRATVAGIYSHRRFVGDPLNPEAIDTSHLYWWDADAERMILEIPWSSRWSSDELGWLDLHWVHVAGDRTLWLLRHLDTGTHIHVFDRELGEVTPPEGEREETRLQAPERQLSSIVAPTDDGGLWYLVDRIGSPGDDAYVLRAVHRDRMGTITALSPPLGDPAATPLDDWRRSARTGAIGRATADGAYVVHFTEGFHETIRSRFVRIEPDGSIAWSVDASSGFLAGTGLDGARATVDERDGGVIAVLLRSGSPVGEARAFGITADGALIHGSDGVRILDEPGVFSSEPRRVDDVLVTDARDRGFHVVLGRGGALTLHFFELDGTRRGDPAGLSLTSELPSPEYAEAWAFSDGEGGIWVAAASYGVGPFIQHVDQDGVPLYWLRSWFCTESFEGAGVGYLRGETPPAEPPWSSGDAGR